MKTFRKFAQLFELPDNEFSTTLPWLFYPEINYLN